MKLKLIERNRAMFKETFAALLLTFSLTANAGFVKTDWKSSGDSLSVLHEETGKEWLSLTQTDGMSINQVIAQLGNGGTFDGWRLPTASEVEVMLKDSFLGFNLKTGKNTYMAEGYNDAYWKEADTDRKQMGGTDYRVVDGSYWAHSLGFHLDDTGTQLQNSGMNHFNWKATPRLYEFNIMNQVSVDSNNWDASSTYYGVDLISDGGTTLSSKLDPTLNINNPDAPINNVPVAYLLSGLGLFFLSLRRK